MKNSYLECHRFQQKPRDVDKMLGGGIGRYSCGLRLCDTIGLATLSRVPFEVRQIIGLEGILMAFIVIRYRIILTSMYNSILKVWID